MSDATQDASADQPADAAAPTDSVNTSRRYFLIGATSVTAGVGVVGAAVPFVQFWNPSAKAKALGAPVTVDISKLAVGEMMTVSWRGKPVFILSRDGDAVSQLENTDLDLADKDSETPQQPEYAVNPTRSSKPEIGVYVGICTHLGCSPKLVETIDTFPQGVGGKTRRIFVYIWKSHLLKA